MKKNLFIILLGFATFYSCKEDDEPIEQDSPKTEEKVKECKFETFVLSSDSYSYFNAEKWDVGAYNSNFDISYGHYDSIAAYTQVQSAFDFKNCDVTDYPKYFIGGPSSPDLKRMKSYNCTRETKFYILPEEFTSAKFDTIKTNNGLVEILSKSTKVANTRDKSCTAIFSDAYGWTEGTLFGFKTEEGKCGIIKILSDEKNFDRHEIGYMQIAVKFESE